MEVGQGGSSFLAVGDPSMHMLQLVMRCFDLLGVVVGRVAKAPDSVMATNRKEGAERGIQQLLWCFAAGQCGPFWTAVLIEFPI